jgi:uncharacterized Zn-finger protein
VREPVTAAAYHTEREAECKLLGRGVDGEEQRHPRVYLGLLVAQVEVQVRTGYDKSCHGQDHTSTEWVD